MVLLVGEGSDHVVDVARKDVDGMLVNDVASERVVYRETEINREGVPVTEDVLYDISVGGSDHRVKILVITDLIEVGPGWKIDV